jgi:transposase
MSQEKKARVFSREFKLSAVKRMLAGDGASALAHELQLRRKLLYAWKDAYLVAGEGALRTPGRPRKDQVVGSPPAVLSARAELLRTRQRIAELERKVGQQQLEHDFFVEALRRVKAVEEAARNAQPSTRSSENKHRKAD